MQDVVYFSDTNVEVTVTVTTPAGCIGIDSAHITVYPGNFANLTPGQAAICPGDSVQLIVSGGISYHWYPSYYLSDTLSSDPIVHPTTTQYYYAIVTSDHGCLDTVGVDVTVYPAAVLNLGDSISLYPGESYQFNPETNCLTFSWFPYLGLSDAYISNPVAMPDVSTKYIVHASTEWGCTTVDSVNVYVDPGTLLAIPNAFTPGTGPNNELKIIKRGIATLNYFRIFNRWGNKVFETTNIDEGWDGTFNGASQPYDVYVFEVEAVTNTGKIFRKQGNVTLIR
jgi:gliding motility-associated-like protein